MKTPRHGSVVWNHTILRAMFVVPLLVVSIVVAACSQDPLPTLTPFPTYTPYPTFTPFPTATPTPEPTPTPTSPPILPPDPNAPVVYRLERLDFANRDGIPGFVIRMGDLTAWGYEANTRPFAKDGDGIKIVVKVGDQLEIARISNPSRTTADPHGLFNEELGFRIELYPDQEATLTIRSSVCQVTRCGTFSTPGIYVIDDPFFPGQMGRFVIEVVE